MVLVSHSYSGYGTWGPKLCVVESKGMLTIIYTVIRLFQPDSLELRGHPVMFQSTTLQGQAVFSRTVQDNISHNKS